MVGRFHSDDKFIYSVDMMLVYINRTAHQDTKNKLKKIRISIKDFMGVLDHKGWGDSEGNLISPVDVLSNPEKYNQHYEQIMNSDINYPIIYNKHKGIIDGVHRMTKAYLLNKKYINAYIFSDSLLEKFIIGKANEWKKIGKMEIYQYIELYLDKFE